MTTATETRRVLELLADTPHGSLAAEELRERQVRKHTVQALLEAGLAYYDELAEELEITTAGRRALQETT